MGERMCRETAARSHNARVKTEEFSSFFSNHLVPGKVAWQCLVYGKLNATRIGMIYVAVSNPGLISMALQHMSERSFSVEPFMCYASSRLVKDLAL